MTESLPDRINIEQVLRQRLPRLSRLVPRRAVRWLERLICQDRLNQILEENRGLTGADFCRGVLRSSRVTVNLKGEDLLPADSRKIFVSNHPLGGLDGIALVALLQQHYGGKVWVVVNDLLMAVSPLADIFLPINKYGRQEREAVRRIDQVFAGPDPVIMFPAGMVSRLHNTPLLGGRRRVVADLPWNKMFVNKAVAFRRDVVPLNFAGANSLGFYRAANRRKRLGLKFNYEMALLPRELVRSQGSSYTVTAGSTIPWKTFSSGGDAKGYATAVQALVYAMAPFVPPRRKLPQSAE